MTPLEIAASVITATSIWLSVRQSVWSWPTGIVSVILYAVVFRDAKLYANMGLQAGYAVLSVYGWYQWLHGGANRTELHVSRTTPRLGAVLALIAAVGSVVIGGLLWSSTDAVLPFIDAFLSSTSLVAQWMMTRKKLENWLVWIAVDVLSVGMFTFEGLYLTAVLYAVLLTLAIQGWLEWRRSLSLTAGRRG